MLIKKILFLFFGTLIIMDSSQCVASGKGGNSGNARVPDSSDQSIQLQNLGGENNYPLTLGGYAVGNFDYDPRTHVSSFSTGKIAVSFFKQANDNIYFFGQLTTSMSPPTSPGGDATTDVEIDDYMLNYTPTDLPELSLTFGRYFVPISFEMDDEVLNLQSNSLDFLYGRPSKMTGLIARYAVSPECDLAGYISNGWDMPFSTGSGKTGGGMVELIPDENLNFAVNGIYGSQPDNGIEANRFLTSISYVWQPTGEWILAGEYIYGGEKSTVASGLSGHWTGGYMEFFKEFGSHFGAALRGEVFNDINGLRTGESQTIRGITFTPSYFVGTGQAGIFANIERTTFRIPKFQVRAEVSLLNSTSPFFSDGTSLVRWSTQYSLQMIITL